MGQTMDLYGCCQGQEPIVHYLEQSLRDSPEPSHKRGKPVGNTYSSFESGDRVIDYPKETDCRGGSCNQTRALGMSW